MSETSSHTLTIERVFDAPVAKVWEAWTNSEVFAEWYGSPGEMVDVSIDLKVGGQWRGTALGPDGSRTPQVGVYRRIDKHKELQFEAPEFEAPRNSGPTSETMNVVFEDAGGGKTKMTFTQTGHLPAETYNGDLKKGWNGFFDKLALRLK